ncbi:MAG: RNA polymerase sigma factor [Acidobacteriota bacterium]
MADTLDAIRRLRAGIDADEAYRILDADLRPRLHRYFRAHGFSPEDAEDLVQKTLARVLDGVRQLKDETKLMPWLFTIARHVRSSERHRLAASQVDPSVELTDDLGSVPAADHAARADAEDRFRAIEAAIESLPARQRQCLLLRVRDELSYAEIAGVLAISMNTVRNHLADAKKGLGRILGVQVDP